MNTLGRRKNVGLPGLGAISFYTGPATFELFRVYFAPHITLASGMALKATIYKADLQVSDMDRGYYATHSLVLALHPSETEERMMLRVLAFALNADDELMFGKGISSEEPDLWRHDLTGQIVQWMEIGQPDEQLLRRAAGRAREVIVYQPATRGAAVWWEKNATALRRIPNLKLFQVAATACDALAGLANRNMQLQCLVQDGVVHIMSDTASVQLELQQLVPETVR